MSIILNESEWVEKAISTHDLGPYPFETLNRLAKYYYKNQYSKTEVRKKLADFVLQSTTTIPLSKWMDEIDRISNRASKHKLVEIDSIDITETEFARIRSLNGIQLQRLAFTLLCVAKYWDIVFDGNNHWTHTPDKDIMKMANISNSIKRQSFLFAQLRDAGLIRFSKKIDSLSVQVLFIEDGKVAANICDFRNLGWQYQSRYESGFFECANCGLTVKQQPTKNGAPRKYCPSCAIEVKTKQSVNAVMRQRNGLCFSC